jgi:hypothetical protein
MNYKFSVTLILFISLSGKILLAQWSPEIRITDSKSKDQHITLSDKKTTWESSTSPEFIVFERTDSNGTNICAAYIRNTAWPAKPNYLTTGDGLNGYPTTSTNMVIFHKIKGGYSNIYYSKYSNSGFSEPLPLTNDTNKFNLFPKCFSLMPYIEEYAVVWERENKIYFKKFDGQNWSSELKITPEDTFSYNSPAISYMNGKYNIAYHKYINILRQDILCTKVDPKNNIVDDRYSITVDGYNQNPRFINGLGRHLTWEKKENNKWVIYENQDILSSIPSIRNRILLSDSLYDLNNFIGMVADLPVLKFEKKECEVTIKDVNSFIMAYAYNATKDGIKYLVLNSMSNKYILPYSNINNHALTQYHAGNVQKVWVIWEAEIGGYINLYGSTDEIRPSSIDDVPIPKKFKLYQNFPNPFNPATNIKFDLPKATNVSIKIYDLLGKEITTLKNEYMNAGYYNINFNAKNLSSGLYIYRIVTDNNIQSKKLSVLK